MKISTFSKEIYVYPTVASIYVLICVFLIAPPESASPDLNFLLLQKLIISPSIWIVFTIQILGEYSYSYTLLPNT